MTLFYSFLNNIFAMLAVAIIHGFIIKRLKEKVFRPGLFQELFSV